MAEPTLTLYDVGWNVGLKCSDAEGMTQALGVAAVPERPADRMSVSSCGELRIALQFANSEGSI